MYKKHIFIIGMIIVQVFSSIYASSLASWDARINNVGLGASPNEVTDQFGEPTNVWVPDSKLIGDAELYDLRYDYGGIIFSFHENRLELIEIVSRDYSIGNGLRVGAEYKGSSFAQIENSDCGIEFIAKDNVIEKIKIYCLN